MLLQLIFYPSVPSLQLKNVHHYYNSLHVLDGISLDVNEGEIISIVGPSGCGKTTLLRVIGGLLDPSRGEIKVNDSSLDVAKQRREFGFAFQNPVLLPWRTVSENVELPLEILGDTTPSKEAGELLRLFGLEQFRDYLPNSLSGGMQQRVSLARALVFNPNILLMDEPFGALDELTREKLNVELLRIWEKTNKTIFFVTHSISEAVFLSHRVLVLSKRPANIAAIREIDLERPRKLAIKQSTDYFNHVIWIRQKLET